MKRWSLWLLALLVACSDNSNDPQEATPVTTGPPDVCGDGQVGASEECDDANLDDGDGCSAQCRYEPSVCPLDMVLISSNLELGLTHAVCMDRYEASRSDATADSQGGAAEVAISQAGVVPWHVNPMSLDALETFQLACAAAGKRLCSKQEWFASCAGPDGLRYSFGDAFDSSICNCVDTFCEQYCEERPEIPDCNVGEGCGYTYYCFHVVPTGTFPGCTNSAGAFDVCGNAWEVVLSAEDWRGYEVRGGAFNCSSPSRRLQCTYNARWTNLVAGFRCCQDIR